jgi:hypothetical protein
MRTSQMWMTNVALLCDCLMMTLSPEGLKHVATPHSNLFVTRSVVLIAVATRLSSGAVLCLKVATHVTASLTSLHDQSSCTRTHKIPSPPHGTSTLEQAPVCTWNMSNSDDDALALAVFVLMCTRKPRQKKRDVWCKDWV